MPASKSLNICIYPYNIPHPRVSRASVGLADLPMTGLPSNSGQKARRPRANEVLPRLIEQEDSQTEGSWQEPVLDRHFSRVDGVLDGRDVTEDKDNNDGEEHAREEEPVLVIVSIVLPRSLEALT